MELVWNTEAGKLQLKCLTTSQVMTTGQQPSYLPSQPFPRRVHIKPLLIILLARNYCFSLRFLQSTNSRERAGLLTLTSDFRLFSISATWAWKRQMQENPKACTYKCRADREDGFGSLCLSQTFLPFTWKVHKLLPLVMTVLTVLTMCSKTELWGKSESFQDSFHKQTKDHIAVLDWKEVIFLTPTVKLVLLLKPL